MTAAERLEHNRLYFDHCKRAGDFLVDKLLCIRSFANRAHARSRSFIYFSTGAIR